MKFFSAIFSLSPIIVACSKDQFHYFRPDMINGPNLWHFGSGGLKIYSPDGSEELKSTPREEICHNVTYYDYLQCNFYDVVSDGKKYVWAAVSHTVTKIDVFDIDSGATVGSFETCEGPRDIEYHPLRDEIWVRCANKDPDDEFGGYVDVFSASAPTADTVSSIDLSRNSTLHSYGYSVIDNSLGDVGYATVKDQPTLYKIDLSERTVINSFELPLAWGGFEVAYSRQNRHIYVRANVCCTCGFVGADSERCQLGPSDVLITTGPLAGQIAQGQCGYGCDGTSVDTLGVIEFDTRTDTIIGNHRMPDGIGGDPFSSPDGRFIVLIARNGGEVIRVLAPGGSGEKSTVVRDIELGFSTEGVETYQVFNDFAFIQTSANDMGGNVNRDMVIVASGTENKVAIIDILCGYNVTIVSLRDENFMSARNYQRQVEWVVGTPYVWIDGSYNKEVYVLNIDTKQVEKTINGIYTTKMLSVENYEHKFITDLITREVSEAISNNESEDESEDEEEDEDEDESDDDMCGVFEVLFELNLHTDLHGEDISWRLEKNTRGTIWDLFARNGVTYGNDTMNHEKLCIPKKECYMFTISDAAQDGLCCTYSRGYYSIFLGGEELKYSIYSNTAGDEKTLFGTSGRMC